MLNFARRYGLLFRFTFQLLQKALVFIYGLCWPFWQKQSPYLMCFADSCIFLVISRKQSTCCGRYCIPLTIRSLIRIIHRAKLTFLKYVSQGAINMFYLLRLIFKGGKWGRWGSRTQIDNILLERYVPKLAEKIVHTFAENFYKLFFGYLAIKNLRPSQKELKTVKW